MWISIDFSGVQAPVYVEYGEVTEGIFKGQMAYRFPGKEEPRVCSKAKLAEMSKKAEEFKTLNGTVKWQG